MRPCNQIVYRITAPQAALQSNRAMLPMSKPPAASGDNTPAVSVIVPTHDRQAMLVRAIDSVLAQTCTDFELIVVDDASVDGTGAWLQTLSDPRLRCLRFDTAGGAPRARNLGIGAARGRYVAFLDDDDEWLPRKLELQLAAFERGSPRLGLVHGGSAVIAAQSGRVVHTVVPTPGLATRAADFLGEITFTTSVVMIRRQCFDAIGGFDESLAGAQDRDLWIRLAGAFEFDAVPEVLLRRFVHGAQITSSLPAKILAKQQIIAKYRRELRAMPRRHAHHLWRLGILQCVAGDRAGGRRTLLASLVAYPWQRAAWRDLLTTLRPRDRCRDRLAARRLETVDGVRLYY